MMNGSDDSVVVIGGGVIGAACAYYLARRGRQVTIVDKGSFGRGCSHGNCGLICPSHVLPLAVPGAIGKSLVSMLRGSRALRIRPRLDPALWRWLLGFASRCRVDAMLEAGRARQALLDASVELYREIFIEESIECEWERRGLLFVFSGRRAFDDYGEANRLLRDQFGVEAIRYAGEALTELEPALRSGLAGGWHYEGDAHLRPDLLMAAWRAVLERLGVTIREDCDVKSFAGDSSRAVAVETSEGDIPAAAFVVATGVWTPFLARHLGCRVPIQPGKGYSLTMARPAVCPSIPMVLEESHVVVTPMRSAYRLGSTMEFAGYDDSLPQSRLEILERAARRYLREPVADPIEEAWFGWRPMVYDGKPLIGFSPALRNVCIAAGHGMLGLSMAPATGKLVAQLLGGEETHVDLAPYRVTRFM